MKIKLTLSIIVLITLSLYLFNSISAVNQHAASKPTIAHTEEQSNLETYTYKITKIDHTGYYGTSTKDDTGIYFVNENVPKGTEINVNDTVKVSFPLNNYEEITHIEKIN
jgi:uncharacterized protein YabE (DUF348 family)